jgi:hypothetical protein
MKGCDEEGGVVIKGVIAGDSEEEVLVNVLVLGAPDLFTTLVDNGVLVGMVGDSGDTRWDSEEVGEEFSF